LFVYHLFADRLTPFTTQASVEAFVVPISPEAAGLVTEVNVIDDVTVESGEVLVRIDPERYRLAVAGAEATLAQSGQDIGAAAANVSTAQAQLEDARANLTHMRKQSVRVENLVAQRAMAAARLDQAIAAVAHAEAAVAAAEANLVKAREQLGPRGSDNPKVKAAISALGLARRQLEDTLVRAPSRGVITGLQIAAGNYAAVGRPLMTFIAADEVWIEADMRENNLGRLQRGDPVEIVLDVDPGAVHAGSVVSIGWGVGQGARQRAGGAADGPPRSLLGARSAALSGAHRVPRKSVTPWRSRRLAGKRHRLYWRSSGPQCSRPPPDPAVQHPDVCLLKPLGRILWRVAICINYGRKGGRCD
jgi:multidrug resistance efflux pump